MPRRYQIVAAFLLVATGVRAAEPIKKLPTRSVGMPARVESLVLPGAELEARPIEDRQAPVVLRVVDRYPHGDSFRYDLEYYGLEPGTFDLRDYLRRKDGSTLENLPPLTIQVTSLLPPGQPLPHELAPGAVPRIGGYRLLLITGAVFWVAGLAAIIFSRRRARHLAAQHAAPRVSFAERLRPLVSSAIAGELSPEQQAELERLLVVYWRHRLNLTELEPHQLLARLRNDDQAGQLLRQVESWLHQPRGDREVDIAAVLAPYRDLPDEAATPASVPQRGELASAGRTLE